MAINIKNREVESLLEELKAETGRGTTEIVLELARQEVERRRRLRSLGARRARIQVLLEQHRAGLPPDLPTPDEVIGYDDDGLPR